jgi:hypothetical protein
VDLQNLLHLRTFCKCGNLQICDLRTLYFLRFADPNFFCGLKTLQIRKCSNSNFYKIKNSAKQTCSRFLDSFAMKGGNFCKRCFILSVYSGKLMDLQFADSHISEIGRFAIADWAQQFEDFKIFACPPLQICHRCQWYRQQICCQCQQHWWQIVTGINNTGSKFTTPVANNGNNISLLTP